MSRSGGKSAQFKLAWGRHAVWPAAVAFGLYWGFTTVAAFRPDYLPEPAYAALRDGSLPGDPNHLALTDAASAACGGDCSDFDLGYRWASLSDADAAGECYDASWSFRRGCLAFLRSEGHFAPAPEPAEVDFAEVAYPPVYREVEGAVARERDVQPFEGELLTLEEREPLPPAIVSSAESPKASAAGQVPPSPIMPPRPASAVAIQPAPTAAPLELTPAEVL